MSEPVPVQPSESSAPLDLIVFSDDWGRHPSSCQHLVRHLLAGRHRVWWVNTIGTRLPGLNREDWGKVVAKVGQWLGPRPPEAPPEAPPDSPPDSPSGASQAGGVPANLRVVNPKMYPGFRRGWQRRLNRRLIVSAVHAALPPREAGRVRVALTTLPITADLALPASEGGLDVDRWVYYCVDDFSVWPGLDADVMRLMEAELVRRVDAAAAVSEVLVANLGKMGKPATLLTHGIDLAHWGLAGASGVSGGGASGGGGGAAAAGGSAQTDSPAQPQLPGGQMLRPRLPDWWPGDRRPMVLFWGLIDPRLEVSWCRALAADPRFRGQIVLVGPQQSADPALGTLPGVLLPGPVEYERLPALAQAADVLVMPYRDMPATQAMQPLKFKEYLATGKPVVARRLPSTQAWSDAADLVDTAGEFVEAVLARSANSLPTATLPGAGVPGGQVQARARLSAETWAHKARILESLLQVQGRVGPTVG
jgi:hypothetical protein